jgi:hypothetical protein
MPVDPSECRQHALDCVRMAQTSKRPHRDPITIAVIQLLASPKPQYAVWHFGIQAPRSDTVPGDSFNDLIVRQEHRCMCPLGVFVSKFLLGLRYEPPN